MLRKSNSSSGRDHDQRIQGRLLETLLHLERRFVRLQRIAGRARDRPSERLARTCPARPCPRCCPGRRSSTGAGRVRRRSGWSGFRAGRSACGGSGLAMLFKHVQPAQQVARHLLLILRDQRAHSETCMRRSLSRVCSRSSVGCATREHAARSTPAPRPAAVPSSPGRSTGITGGRSGRRPTVGECAR